MTTERASIDAVMATETCNDKDRLIALYRHEMRSACRELAEAGSYDHRAKNERILQVIASLMRMASLDKTSIPMDELPF